MFVCLCLCVSVCVYLCVSVSIYIYIYVDVDVKLTPKNQRALEYKKKCSSIEIVKDDVLQKAKFNIIVLVN